MGFIEERYEDMVDYWEKWDPANEKRWDRYWARQRAARYEKMQRRKEKKNNKNKSKMQKKKGRATRRYRK